MGLIVEAPLTSATGGLRTYGWGTGDDGSLSSTSSENLPRPKISRSASCAIGLIRSGHPEAINSASVRSCGALLAAAFMREWTSVSTDRSSSVTAELG